MPGKSTPIQIPTTNHLLPLDLELTRPRARATDVGDAISSSNSSSSQMWAMKLTAAQEQQSEP
jgi:hypothetical protein